MSNVTYVKFRKTRRKYMSLPKDPVMLLSVVNTKLRDFYPNLEELAKAEDITAEEIIQKLAAINYTYDENHNRFS